MSEVTAEVQIAETFTPVLAGYLIVTSLDRDAGLQAGRAAARKNLRSRLARVALLVAWFVPVAAGHGIRDDGADEVQREICTAPSWHALLARCRPSGRFRTRKRQGDAPGIERVRINRSAP